MVVGGAMARAVIRVSVAPVLAARGVNSERVTQALWRASGEILEELPRWAPDLGGGCTPQGLDCSGFVQLVYRLHGMGLPRDADQQALAGAPVAIEGDARAELAPGDALFFGAAEERERIVHVGLALGGG